MPYLEPAFPRPASEFTKSGTLHDGNDAVEAQEGMTLRDYFAAKAMQGILANDNDDMDRHLLVIVSYKIADSMLDARKAVRP